MDDCAKNEELRSREVGGEGEGRSPLCVYIWLAVTRQRGHKRVICESNDHLDVRSNQ